MKLLLIILLLTSCSNLKNTYQKINPEVYYRHDMCFTYETDDKVEKKIKGFFKRFRKGKYRKTEIVNKKVSFCGTGVLPYMDQYKIRVKSKSEINFFSMTSCHEETTTENPTSSLFNDGKKVNINYKPTIERGEACPLYFAAYNRRKKHTTGLVVFENPAYKLEAMLYCNGYVTMHVGISVCQSRRGLIQKIEFKEPVAIGDPVIGPSERSSKEPNCPKIDLSEDKKSTKLFKIPGRECIYPFIGLKSGKIHQFYTVGYEGILIRE